MKCSVCARIALYITVVKNLTLFIKIRENKIV